MEIYAMTIIDIEPYFKEIGTDRKFPGFSIAMDISCHSLVRLAKAAEPLMADGGSILTMSYYGSEKVISGYGLIGPVKAALESSVKYLAAELAPQGIRVNALIR
jgi:enoyl-[acyl-carrier protein] reductase I